MVEIIKDMAEGQKEVDAAYLNFIKELVDGKKQATERKMDMMERQIQMQANKQRMDEDKIRLERIAYEERIMLMDTSGLAPDLQQYYNRLKMEILQGNFCGV